MARIILGEMINDIRNSVDAHTYSIWKGVHYLRKKACIVGNPKSSAQGLYRQQVERSSRLWFNTLGPGDRSTFDTLAAALASASQSEATQGSKQIIPFNRGRMSGFNAYIMVNGLIESIGGTASTSAPIGVDAPPSAYNLAVAYVAGPPEKFTLTWDEPASIPVDAEVRIWAMTRKYCHKQFVAHVTAGVKTYDVTALKGAQGASVGLPKDYYMFQIDVVRQEGLKSAGSNIAEINHP